MVQGDGDVDQDLQSGRREHGRRSRRRPPRAARPDEVAQGGEHALQGHAVGHETTIGIGNGRGGVGGASGVGSIDDGGGGARPGITWRGRGIRGRARGRGSDRRPGPARGLGALRGPPAGVALAGAQRAQGHSHQRVGAQLGGGALIPGGARRGGHGVESGVHQEGVGGGHE